MSHFGSKNRFKIAGGPIALLVGLSIATLACEAATPRKSFSYGGEPVHPACVHALTMHQGDAVPVTTAVSLQGCSATRTRSKVRYEGELSVFEDDEVLGGGSFGYREIARLENGIYGLVIRRILPDGEERVSLAAVDLVGRPMLRNGQIVTLEMLELLGELWIPGMDTLTFRSVGNSVRFVAGMGSEKVERDVDFTRLGKLRK